jgi:hypothetical protein
VTRSGQDADPGERTGAFLVRAWLHDRALVARVIRTPDLAAVTPATVMIANPHQLYRELAVWLLELGVAGSEPEPQDESPRPD